MDYDDVGAKNFSKTFKKARSEAGTGVSRGLLLRLSGRSGWRDR